MGSPILFEGTASDDNIDSMDLQVSFASDIDGDLGEATINSSGEISLLVPVGTMHTSFL